MIDPLRKKNVLDCMRLCICDKSATKSRTRKVYKNTFAEERDSIVITKVCNRKRKVEGNNYLDTLLLSL